MALKGLDHVAIAVEKLEPALEVYCKLFGWKNESIEVVEDQQARVARLVNGPHTLELVEPHGPESTVRKFLDRRGPGLHHLCFEVRGPASRCSRTSRRRACASSTRRRGRAPHGRKIAFVHPASCGGVLIELSQR